MLVPADFDYHLTESEQQQIEKLVPLHQAKIHLAFKANIQIGEKELNNAYIALSEHMITICTLGFLKRSIKLYDTYHLFELVQIQTICDETARLEFDENIMYISTPCCVRFIKTLIRNYILANPALPAKLRPKFSTHSPESFPPFKPELSPSQIFQFTYNAYCSYYDSTYYHQVPQYYHKLLSTGNCIFDITKLPFNVVEVNIGDAADIKPIASALMYLPYVFGFSCCNFARPDILESIAPLVECSPSLKMVRIIDSNVIKGGEEISKAMLASDEPGVIYWDLSNNEIEDIGYFISALENYEAEVKTLKLNYCGLTKEDVYALFKSLGENEYMYDIENISILGSEIDKEALDAFIDFLENIADSTEEEEESSPKLNTLAVSRIEDPSAFITSLKQNNIQLTHLTISDTVFDGAAATTLKEYIESLKNLFVLSLDGCTMSQEFLTMIIKAYGQSQTNENLEISLSRMHIFGPLFFSVLDAICLYLAPKLRKLALNENEMTVDDLIFLTTRIFEMVKLKSLSLSRNFSRSSQGVGIALTGLTNAKIEEIIIQGDDNHHLGEELIQLLCVMQLDRHIFSLDISNNDIGDFGLKTLTNLIKASTSIRKISTDSSNPSSFAVIEEFISNLEKDPELVDFPLPFNDIYTQILKDETQSEKIINAVSVRQKKVEDTLMQNRAKIGMHSDLTFLEDAVLNEILDNSTLALQAMLEGVSLTQHLAITEIVGLPLPFEDGGHKEGRGIKVNEDDESYVDPMLLSSVSEGFDSALNALKTLQFNSLLIRRPNAGKKLKDLSAFVPPEDNDDDDDEYEYSDEDDKKKTIKLSNLAIPPPPTTDMPNMADLAVPMDIETAQGEVEPAPEYAVPK